MTLFLNLVWIGLDVVNMRGGGKSEPVASGIDRGAIDGAC